MKKKMILALAFMVLVFASGCGAKESQGLEYELTGGGNCTVTGFGTCKDSHIIIPEQIDDYKVTAIASGAFMGATGITEITIHEQIKSIGELAFAGCSDLEIVHYNTDCATGALAQSTVKKVVFGGTIVPADILWEVTSLKEVVIEKEVTEIGDCAFYFCKNLKSVTISKGVTTIGGDAFAGCSGLTGIVIPEGVTIIGEYAFAFCSGLTGIVIPEGVTAIEEYVFRDCSALKEITIPKSVTEISPDAFDGCSGLETVYYNTDYTDYNTEQGFLASTTAKKVVFGGTTVPKNILAFSESLEEVVIENGVTSIGDWAFEGCNGLKNITIPKSVTNIGDRAFLGCVSLKSITIPNNVTSIGGYAFAACSDLSSVMIPDSVTSIGDGVFYACSGLTSITIPDSVTSIGTEAFGDCSSLKTISIPAGLDVSKARIPDGVQIIRR